MDFLARHLSNGEELVQVCADPSDKTILARELRALTAAGNEFTRAARRLLVLDRDSVPRLATPGVHVQPAYEWLLAAPGED